MTRYRAARTKWNVGVVSVRNPNEPILIYIPEKGISDISPIMVPYSYEKHPPTYFPATKLEQKSNGTWEPTISLTPLRLTWVSQLRWSIPSLFPVDVLLQFEYYNDLRLSAKLGGGIWEYFPIYREYVLQHDLDGTQFVQTTVEMEISQTGLTESEYIVEYVVPTTTRNQSQTDYVADLSSLYLEPDLSSRYLEPRRDTLENPFGPKYVPTN